MVGCATLSQSVSDGLHHPVGQHRSSPTTLGCTGLATAHLAGNGSVSRKPVPADPLWTARDGPNRATWGRCLHVRSRARLWISRSTQKCTTVFGGRPIPDRVPHTRYTVDSCRLGAMYGERTVDSLRLAKSGLYCYGKLLESCSFFMRSGPNGAPPAMKLCSTALFRNESPCTLFVRRCVRRIELSHRDPIDACGIIAAPFRTAAISVKTVAP